MTKAKIWEAATVVVWVTVFVLVSLTVYVNHFMPRGDFYSTGDYSCANDGRGPCGEEMKEDLSTANIPEWAKFFRDSESLVLIGILVFVGIYLGNSENKDAYTKTT